MKRGRFKGMEEKQGEGVEGDKGDGLERKRNKGGDEFEME